MFFLLTLASSEIKAFSKETGLSQKSAWNIYMERGQGELIRITKTFRRGSVLKVGESKVTYFNSHNIDGHRELVSSVVGNNYDKVMLFFPKENEVKYEEYTIYILKRSVKNSFYVALRPFLRWQKGGSYIFRSRNY